MLHRLVLLLRRPLVPLALVAVAMRDSPEAGRYGPIAAAGPAGGAVLFPPTLLGAVGALGEAGVEAVDVADDDDDDDGPLSLPNERVPSDDRC